MKPAPSLQPRIMPDPAAPKRRPGGKFGIVPPGMGCNQVAAFTCGSGCSWRPRAEIFTGRLVDLAHAQLDFTAIVKTEHFDLYRIPELDHIGDFADPLRREFADVHEPVTRSEKVHKGPEIYDLHDLAVIDDADFGFGDDPADPIDRRLRGISVDRGDLDGAVVVDIDLRSRRLGDLADDLAAGTDYLADLFLRDAEVVIRGALPLTSCRAPVKAFAISPRM